MSETDDRMYKTVSLVPTQLWTRVLWLALGYYVLGRLSLLMAIPPGYAAAVWPAAGLALAAVLAWGYRVWPGIFLASVSLNLPMTLVGSGLSVSQAVVTAVVLGGGAAAQALVGAFLVRRFVGYPLDSGEPGRIATLLLLGGPLACLLGATVGVVALSSAGLIMPFDQLFNGFTWWTGDSIGVLMVIPVFLILAADPQRLTRRRKLLVSLPIALMMGLVALLFVRTSSLEQQRTQAEFNRRAERVAQALTRQFAEYVEVLRATADFQALDPDANSDRFASLVAEMLARHPGLKALSWNPRVPLAQRGDFELKAQREGEIGFRIRERKAQGQLVPALDRADYVPITDIQLRKHNAAAIGFDLASDPSRRAALWRARDTGQPAATGPIELLQAPGHVGVVIFQAVYPPVVPTTTAQRRRLLRGYISAVVQLDEMMALFLRQADADGMQLQLEDAAAPTDRRLVYSSAASADVRASEPARRGLHSQVGFQLAQRPWRLLFSLSPEYAASHRSWQSWSVLWVGLLLTALFSAFMLMGLGRTAAVEALVRQRTAELEHAFAAIRASEAQARSVLETARDAYIAMGPDYQIIEWNREAEAIFGWSRSEVLGQPLADVLVPPRFRQAHLRGIAKFVATGEGRIINRRMELSALHRDGHEVPVELTIWATVIDGRYRFNAFLHDISERLRAINRLAAQEAAAAALLASDSLEDAAPRVLQAVCEALDWRVGALWMIDATGDALHCVEFWNQPDWPAPEFAAASRRLALVKGVGLPGEVWAAGKALWIPDVTAHENFPRTAWASKADLHAAFGLPVLSGNQLLGVIEFFSDHIQQPDAGLLKMMDTLGNLLGEFVARKRAEASLFEEKERLEVTLRSIGDGVVVIDAAGRITYLNPVAEQMCGWSIDEARYRPVNEVLQLVDHATGEPGLNPMLMSIRENRILGLAVDTELVRRDGTRAPIEDSAGPIHAADGRVVGSVMVFHDLSESRAMALKMSHLAQHDHLTDLPNRVLLHDRFSQAIARAKRDQQTLALLYMDLDGFKHINDSLGHEVGDRLLQEVAQRLLGSVRGMDTVSRQGGDEFVVLLPQIREASDAARVAEQILQAIRKPFEIDDTELNFTASIGVSLYPDDGADPGDLLKYADAAMYQAKQNGRNQHRFYTRAISERADRRLSIESSLHQALRNEEFVLFYQPKVLPGIGTITGMEALLRWQRGSELLAPGEFLQIAEENGLIERIDRWALGEACRQNRAWQQMGLAHVPVAVNLSAAQAETGTFPTYVASVLAQTGLAPAWLEIEITEGHMLRDTARFEALIQAIRALGVKVAIDDFGTGYSSMGYLCRFDFDVLKIDRSFVSALETDSKQIAVVRAIVRLAQALDCRVVAEGVETLGQERILHEHGCHEMQGYLYSRPLPAAEFERLLRAGSIMPSQSPPYT